MRGARAQAGRCPVEFAQQGRWPLGGPPCGKREKAHGGVATLDKSAGGIACDPPLATSLFFLAFISVRQSDALHWDGNVRQTGLGAPVPGPGRHRSQRVVKALGTAV